MDPYREHMGFIGFTAQLSRDPWIIEKPGDVLKFDACLSNVCRVYDPKTGVFTAPVTGIYHFIISGWCGTESQHTGYTHLVLEKINNPNGVPLASIVLKTPDTVYVSGEGSTDVDLLLHKGDKVTLRHREGSTIIRGLCKTTFSGTLSCLYPDRCPF